MPGLLTTHLNAQPQLNSKRKRKGFGERVTVVLEKEVGKGVG